MKIFLHLENVIRNGGSFWSLPLTMGICAKNLCGPLRGEDRKVQVMEIAVLVV